MRWVRRSPAQRSRRARLTAKLLKTNGWRAGAPFGEGTANFDVMSEWNRSVVTAKPWFSSPNALRALKAHPRGILVVCETHHVCVNHTELDRAGQQLAGDAAVSLIAEQPGALAILATSGYDGATPALLSAHGFDASLIAGLVNHGLATITAEKVRVGGKLIAVARVRITVAGRRAIEGQA
jgi:hypothetical protein